MNYSVAMAIGTNERAVSHLLRGDGQEDACFGLYMPSQGSRRFTGLVTEIVLPEEGERIVRGNVHVATHYFVRVLGMALKRKMGIAIMHSHPSGSGWQASSEDDANSENTFAHTTQGGTGLPLLGMTLSGDEMWSSRAWVRTGKRRYESVPCEKVRVIGSSLNVSFNPELLPAPRSKPELTRTVSAWGEVAQAKLARLRLGIIGLGGVGGIVAEALARMGLKEITLIDFDSVESVNLDRQLHATKQDADRSRPKVRVVSGALRKSATADGFDVIASEWSVVEPEGFKLALDCDILFSCVDRPWPRSALNFIAYAHLIPVVDGGVRVIVSPKGTLKRAYWGAHVVGPARRCMVCLEQYDPGLVSAERDGLLDDPEYISGLPEDEPFRHNENVFSFNLSVASMELLQILSIVVAPHGISNIGAQMYSMVPGVLNSTSKTCELGCAFPR